MKSRELRQEAEFRLGIDVLAEVQKWYTEAVRQPWDYVVYIVRRSYLLALIMEKITGVQMGKGSKFLTDAAFMQQCQKLAQQYRRNHRFPSILLCDDLLIHGRSINHFIDELEKALQDCLPEYDLEEIQQALVRALKIHVYVRTDGPVLLLGRYELNLDYIRREKSGFIKELSNDISSLIVYSGMANASYIYSEWITDEQVDKIDLGQWKKTFYQGVKQYAMVRFIGKPDQIKAVYTLRLVSNRFDGCRLIPFVFLPNLDEEETQKLMWYILERMEQKDFSGEECQCIIAWEQQSGKRSFNELVTLILSSTILREYKKVWDVQGDEGAREQELDKLIRNYNQFGWKFTENFIRKIVLSELFDLQELDELLLKVISDERRVLSVFDDYGREITLDEQMGIVDDLENYFYEQGRQEEIEAYQLSIKPYSEDSRRTRRTARGCCFLLNALAKNYCLEDAGYMMAYFLQMMDAGVLALSSYAPSKVNIVGYAQYAKPGEQSLLLEVLKKFEYIPVLSEMQNNCRFERKSILEEFWEYAVSSYCDLTQDVLEELEEFISKLEEMGHKPGDWNSRNYLFKIDKQYHIKRKGLKDISEYIEKQNEHIRNYRDYLNGKKFVY